MQVFKDIFPICSCSVILYWCDALYITSINLNWIKSSLIVLSACRSFTNSQYLLAFRIGSSISCFIDMNFVLSTTINLFLGLIFLLMIWRLFSKVRSSRFVEYAMVENFIITSHPAHFLLPFLSQINLPVSQRELWPRPSKELI